MLFGSFVFNLGQLSVIRGFLGFAFQFFLLKWDFFGSISSLLVNKALTFIHLLTCRNSAYASPLSPLYTPYLKMSSPGFFFFLNCLNLKVLIATRYLLFREMSPNCSHTKNNKSIVLQIQNVRLYYQRVLLFLLVSISMKGIEYWREADSFSVCF